MTASPCSAASATPQTRESGSQNQLSANAIQTKVASLCKSQNRLWVQKTQSACFSGLTSLDLQELAVGCRQVLRLIHRLDARGTDTEPAGVDDLHHIEIIRRSTAEVFLKDG